MTNNFDELAGLEYEMPDEAQGDGLNRIWWHNGVSKAKTAGSFYTRAEDWAGPLPEPWQGVERFEGELGWFAETLKIVPLTYRSQPFAAVKDAAGNKRREYAAKWQQGMSIHTEILCLVEGVEGPVVWSVKGMVGKEVLNTVFAQARQRLIVPGEARLRKRLPMWSFWLPVTQRRTAAGKLDYVSFPEGGEISPPALVLPDLHGPDLLNALYVGKALFEEAAAIRQQYEEWRHERRGNEPEVLNAVPVHAVPVTAATNGRNEPQALTLDPNGDPLPF